MQSIPRRENLVSSTLNMASTKTLTAAIAAVLMLTATATATAQFISCAYNLIPCAAYLNSTKPPASCCDALKESVTKELSCLCNLYNNPELLKSLGVNITEALQLPKHCGISNDVSACDKASTPKCCGRFGVLAFKLLQLLMEVFQF
nr:lipid transfer-like protein VAS [Ipomoea trifida]